LGDDTVDELVSIGRIVGTHGYKGTLKVQLLTDFPERFQELKLINLSQGKKVTLLRIESCSPYKDLMLIKLEGIDDLETAQLYRNALLGVEEKDIFPLPPGYYYHFQLVGLAVYDTERGYLGVLKEVLETGANDVYAVNSEIYGEILLPAIKDVILDIDLVGKKMTVKLLDGLLD
jgi:16S rRNA processing protein RimM